jgi:hypothetical protein
MAKPGQAIRRGDLLARLHASDRPSADAGLQRLAPAFVVASARPRKIPLIAETIS